MARSLQFQANLPIHLWGYCILASTYLINRLPSSVLHDKSPYELLYHKQPDLTHLRVIGCLAYAYNNTTDKFQPKAIPTVFIGYPQNQKGYLLYDTSTHKVLTSRNVLFHEHSFPFHTHPSTVQTHSLPHSTYTHFEPPFIVPSNSSNTPLTLSASSTSSPIPSPTPSPIPPLLFHLLNHLLEPPLESNTSPPNSIISNTNYLLLFLIQFLPNIILPFIITIPISLINFFTMSTPLIP